MKYVFLIILIFLSFVTSRLLLWIINPDDPEGTNLLVTTVVAGGVFLAFWLVRIVVSKITEING